MSKLTAAWDLLSAQDVIHSALEKALHMSCHEKHCTKYVMGIHRFLIRTTKLEKSCRATTRKIQ